MEPPALHSVSLTSTATSDTFTSAASSPTTLAIPTTLSLPTPKPEGPRGNASYAYVGDLLGLPWPLPELQWVPAEHGRPPPLYQPEDHAMDAPGASDGVVYTAAEGFAPVAAVDSEAVLQEFLTEKERAGYFSATAAADRTNNTTALPLRPTTRHAAEAAIRECRSRASHWKANLWGPQSGSIRSSADVAAAAAVRQRYGIITTPKFMHARILPLLATSLANATTVDIFIRKSLVSHHYVRYLLGKIKETHQHSAGIRVVELYGPPNSVLAKRSGNHFQNAWINLEVLRFWRAEHEAEEDGRAEVAAGKVAESDLPAWLRAERTKRSRAFGIASTIANLANYDGGNMRGQSSGGVAVNAIAVTNDGPMSLHSVDWYSVMDDDGYAFLESIRTVLATFQRAGGDDWATKPVLMGHSVRGILVHPIAHGGPGFHFNKAALERLSMRVLDSCGEKYGRFDAGDGVSGYCLSSVGAPLVEMPHVHCYLPDRAIGEFWWDRKSPFPAAFHQARGPQTFERFAAVERLRAAAGHLPTWDDVLVNMIPNGVDFLRDRLEQCLYCHAPTTDVKCRKMGYAAPIGVRRLTPTWRKR